MESALRNRLIRAIEERVFPGAVVGIVGRDGKREIFAEGRFTYEPESPRVMADTSYDVASITKSIPTSSIALKLIEEGKLSLDDKLVTHLPTYKNNYTHETLIRHLLTYAIIPDFPTPGFDVTKATAQEIGKNLPHVNLKARPGEQAKYSNLPALLLSLVIENITGSTVDKVGHGYFFKPLGMTNSTFFPRDQKSIPPTEIDEWRGLVQGFVHDETSFVLEKEHPMGCAGLFTNVPDILIFLEMLLNEGSLSGIKYFEPATVAQMHTNQLSLPGVSMGLGWELNEPRFMGNHVRPSTFGKTGFTGTLCVVDPERETAFAVLSNRTYPKRSSPDAINELRRDISDIVLGTGA
ncbi:MAG: serine hydrolase domain-containing protein [bacterium]